RLEGRSTQASPELQTALAHDPSRSLVELKLKVSQQLDALGEEVQADIAGLADARRAIKFERRRLLESQTAEQQQLVAEIGNVRSQWDKEQQDHGKEQERQQQEQLKTRQREDDDYRYNLLKTGRNEEDGYNQKHAAR